MASEEISADGKTGKHIAVTHNEHLCFSHFRQNQLFDLTLDSYHTAQILRLRSGSNIQYSSQLSTEVFVVCDMNPT